MIRQKMDSLSFELLSRMAHMMTRMTHMTRSLARWLTVCRDPLYLGLFWCPTFVLNLNDSSPKS